MSRLSEPLQHDDLLNYRLKRLLAVGGAPAIRLCEGRYGITRLEWRILAALVEDGPRAPGALAQDVHVESGRTSQVLGRLKDKGLARRERADGAGRRATVEATIAGCSLYAELWPQIAAINRRIVAALDEAETLALDACLTRLTQRAEEIAAEGGGVEVRADRRLGGSRRFWR